MARYLAGHGIRSPLRATSPGRLIRPLLLVRSGMGVGGELCQIVPAALGFEAAHTASLIHDDVVDGDDLRRGRLSVSKRFGVSQAVVAGDGLFFIWFALLAEGERRGIPAGRISEVAAVHARTGVAMCRGAFAELGLTGGLSNAIGEYISMCRLKTAALMEAACRAGAILGGGDDQSVEALADGRSLGLAFQIRDDLLPYRAGEAGKPRDSDLRNQRPTPPVLLAIRDGDRRQRDRLEAAFTAIDSAGAAAILRETGALRSVEGLAAQYGLQARRALVRMPANGAIEQLRRTALGDGEHTQG